MINSGGATKAELKEEYKDWLYPPGVDLKFDFQKREEPCSVRKFGSEDRYEDVGAPFKPSWRIFRCANRYWKSFPQKSRLTISVIGYLLSASLDYISDWIVFGLEISKEDLSDDKKNVAWAVLVVLVISALNSTLQAWEMFDHEFNYIVFFSFFGLGSLVFGVDLLVFGFGPIFYKLSYSSYSKFNKLRYYESGFESLFSVYVQFVVLYQDEHNWEFTLFSLCVSTAVYSMTRTRHLNEKNRDFYFPTMKMLLGAFILFDLIAAANIYAFFLVNESGFHSFIFIMAGIIMFFLYVCYFVFYDKETFLEAFVNGLSSLFTSIPLFESEFNSLYVAGRNKLIMIFISARVIFNISLIYITSHHMEFSFLIRASLLAAGDFIIKMAIFGWYWVPFKLIHITWCTWQRDVLKYKIMEIYSKPEELLDLMRRDMFSPEGHHCPSRTLLEARICGTKHIHKLEKIFSRCNSEKFDFVIERRNFLKGTFDFNTMFVHEYNHPEVMLGAILSDPEVMLSDAPALFKSHPYFYTGYNWIAMEFKKRQEFEISRIMYERSLEINPNDASTHYNLALLLQETHFKDSEGSLDHYLNALEIDPNNADAHYNLSILLQGDYFEDAEGATYHRERAFAIDVKSPNDTEIFI